jgi:6-phosphogluconolactonase
VPVKEGDGVTVAPATMSLFRIGGDGRLTYIRKYDVDVGGASLWWMGMVELPG